MTKKYRIGLVSTEQFSVGFQEQLLIEGHTLVMILLYHGFPITEDSGLAQKYPKQFKCVNLGSFYKSGRDLGGPLMRADVDKLVAEKVDFIFFDYNRPSVLDAADYVRTKHPHVIGPTHFTNALEFNRSLGKRFASMCGMGSASHHEFKSIEAAARFVEKTKKNYLLKGSDDTVFPVNWKDCLDFLRHDYFDFIKGDKCVFLEEELVDHFETSCAAFFNGVHYLPHVLFNREYKGVQPETRGHIFSGESGTMSQLVPFHQVPEQIAKVFENAVPTLMKCGYKGYIDFNVMLNLKTNEYRFLEWTCRPGVPTEVTIAALYGKDGLYGTLRAASAGLGVTYPPMPRLRQAVTVPLMHYSPGVSAKKAAQIMPLIHGLDKMNRQGLLPSGKGTVKVMLQDAQYVPTQHDKRKGVLDVRCWGSHDRPVVFVGLHNDIQKGVPALYNVLHEHKVGAWAHTWRDDIGADLVASGNEELIDSFGAFSGALEMSWADQAAMAKKLMVRHHEFTEEVFLRTLPLEMNSSDVTMEALDEYHNYSKGSQCLIATDTKTNLDIGFLVWSVHAKINTIYLDNAVSLKDRCGIGSCLMDAWLKLVRKSLMRVRLQCHPTLVKFYEKHGFKTYGKIRAERVYMELHK